MNTTERGLYSRKRKGHYAIAAPKRPGIPEHVLQRRNTNKRREITKDYALRIGANTLGFVFAYLLYYSIAQETGWFIISFAVSLVLYRAVCCWADCREATGKGFDIHDWYVGYDTKARDREIHRLRLVDGLRQKMRKEWR